MAPPIPVYSINDVQNQYKQQLNNLEKYQCHLKSITQHECTFKPNKQGVLSSSTSEIICLPFKRIFQRCLIPTMIKIDGKKVKQDRWINIEITNSDTNHDLFVNEKYSVDVKDFLNAEKEFRKLMEIELENSE